MRKISNLLVGSWCIWSLIGAHDSSQQQLDEALIQAIQDHNAPRVQELLHQGANPNQELQIITTGGIAYTSTTAPLIIALNTAMETHDNEIVKHLLDAGAQQITNATNLFLKDKVLNLNAQQLLQTKIDFIQDMISLLKTYEK